MIETLHAWQAGLPPLVFDFLKFFNGLVLLAVIFVPLERLFSLRPKAALRPGWRNDVAYYFLSSVLPNRLIVLPVAALLWGLQSVAPQGLLPGLGQLPGWERFAAAMVLAEIGFYWGHRWLHASPRLWRFHAVHHSATELDWLVNTRAHPVDLVFVRLCGLLPLYVLGLAQSARGEVDWVALLVNPRGQRLGLRGPRQPALALRLAGARRRDPGVPSLASRPSRRRRAAARQLRGVPAGPGPALRHLAPAC